MVVEDFRSEGTGSGPERGDVTGRFIKTSLYQYRHIITVTVPLAKKPSTFLRDKRIGADLSDTASALLQDEAFRRLGVKFVVRGSYRKHSDSWIINLVLFRWSPSKESNFFLR